MTIKLELGKLYRTRDGRKAFCSVYSQNPLGYHYACLIEGKDEVWSYTEQGRVIHDAEHAEDIVAEWSEWQPIETVNQKDEVDIYDRIKGRVCNCRFYKGAWRNTAVFGHDIVCNNPTHWMPLPEVPE